jgi:hypothetical protein
MDVGLQAQRLQKARLSEWSSTPPSQHLWELKHSLVHRSSTGLERVERQAALVNARLETDASRLMSASVERLRKGKEGVG